MKFGRALWAGAGVVALTLSLLLIPSVRVDAQQWVGGFLRDTFGALYVTCETGGCPTPAPAPTSPTGNLAENQQMMGSGANVFWNTWPDQLVSSPAITTATTTVLIPGIANERIYAFFLGVEATGTESGASFSFEQSTSSTCASGNTPLFQNSQTAPPAVGNFTPAFSGSASANANDGISPTTVPWILVVGNTLCVVSAGTTINFSAIYHAAQR